jgi:asparagine synthase (glutamine-hydrolysing)
MCGIYAVLGTKRPVVPDTASLSHRGPDDYNMVDYKNCLMEFWRLVINGERSVTGDQPMYHSGKMMVCNGEVYNYLELGGQYGESDCEVIMPLIEEHGLTRGLEMINGDFALVISDGQDLWAARDRVGVRPLFYTRYEHGIAFASEVKSLLHFGTKVEIFPPGHFYDSKFDKFFCYAPMYYSDIKRGNMNVRELYTQYQTILDNIEHHLNEAVRIRMETSEFPVGFFLSGGLDSSIIAAIGASLSKTPIRTFSIGLEGHDSPDLKAARTVARYLNSNHTEVTFTVDEGIKALDDVIWHLESYDTTTIRASVPMYLLSKYIFDNTDIKVVLSGEGSDELFGGYLYFHNAPNTKEFSAETKRLLFDVHKFDVLRADRCTAAHGLELRVPFFDPNFIEYVMGGFDPIYKIDPVEKQILRDAFIQYLPLEIITRQKNGMSDAVGYNWVDGIKQYCASKVFGPNTETGMYRKIFRKYFGNNAHLTPYMWMPKWSNVDDPSARHLSVFKDKTVQEVDEPGWGPGVGAALMSIGLAYITYNFM